MRLFLRTLGMGGPERARHQQTHSPHPATVPCLGKMIPKKQRRQGPQKKPLLKDLKVKNDENKERVGERTMKRCAGSRVILLLLLLAVDDGSTSADNLVFDVTHYGAVGDGIASDTRAIR